MKTLLPILCLALSPSLCLVATAPAAAAEIPVVEFKWDDLPLAGDSDVDAKQAAIKEKYGRKGVRFTAKCTAVDVEKKTVSLEHKLKRGETEHTQTALITFIDEKPRKLDDLTGKQVVVLGAITKTTPGTVHIVAKSVSATPKP